MKFGYILTFALAISLTPQAKAQVVIDDQTPCAAAIDALESPDKERCGRCGHTSKASLGVSISAIGKAASLACWSE